MLGRTDCALTEVPFYSNPWNSGSKGEILSVSVRLSLTICKLSLDLLCSDTGIVDGISKGRPITSWSFRLTTLMLLVLGFIYQIVYYHCHMDLGYDDERV